MPESRIFWYNPKWLNIAIIGRCFRIFCPLGGNHLKLRGSIVQEGYQKGQVQLSSCCERYL
jgi:hypothetical protein